MRDMAASIIASPLPWKCGSALGADDYAWVMRRAIFDCCKWHTQVEDRPIVCPFPLVIEEAVWTGLGQVALRLAGESIAAERELLGRHELHRFLGLPAPVRTALRAAAQVGPTAEAARVIRFDFHWTTDGWRISEANADAAGGFVEASGVTQLIAERSGAGRPAGDPARVLCDAILGRVGRDAIVGLMHMTIYSEDRQVMLFLARRLEEIGLNPCLVGHEQLRWRDGRAMVETARHTGPIDLAFRFFPAEWLPRLPAQLHWEHFFFGGATPVCNPGYAVLTQTKRFPIVWDKLKTAVPTWRALLPETRSPCDAREPLDRNWILKPALGHEGRDVAIHGVTGDDDCRRIQAAARAAPDDWAVQRRFEVLPLATPEGLLYPCLGIYVIAGQVAGAYGRMGMLPLIDDRSRDIAVLVEESRP
jgi:glutathionylspermidine synthase